MVEVFSPTDLFLDNKLAYCELYNAQGAGLFYRSLADDYPVEFSSWFDLQRCYKTYAGWEFTKAIMAMESLRRVYSQVPEELRHKGVWFTDRGPGDEWKPTFLSEPTWCPKYAIPGGTTDLTLFNKRSSNSAVKH